MSETDALLSVLRQAADADCAAAIERTIREGSDRDLCRVNVLSFAGKHGLDEEKAISAFLHAARLGLFELSWNVLCPGCGGVLDAVTKRGIVSTQIIQDVEKKNRRRLFIEPP